MFLFEIGFIVIKFGYSIVWVFMMMIKMMPRDICWLASNYLKKWFLFQNTTLFWIVRKQNAHCIIIIIIEMTRSRQRIWFSRLKLYGSIWNRGSSVNFLTMYRSVAFPGVCFRTEGTWVSYMAMYNIDMVSQGTRIFESFWAEMTFIF